MNNWRRTPTPAVRQAPKTGNANHTKITICTNPISRLAISGTRPFLPLTLSLSKGPIPRIAVIVTPRMDDGEVKQTGGSTGSP
jgi:hypothetical protein